MFCIECLKQNKRVKAEMIKGRIWSDKSESYIPYKGRLCSYHQGELLEGAFSTDIIKTPELSSAQKAILQRLNTEDMLLHQFRVAGHNDSWDLDRKSVNYRLADVLRNKGFIEVWSTEGPDTYWVISKLGKEVLKDA